MSGRQSPIDIPSTAPVHRAGLDLPYGTIPLVLGQNPLAIQVDCTREVGVVLGGRPYTLVQFHLHCPAEHTLAGVGAAMELHLVHEAAEGDLAVVGVRFEEGSANPAIDALTTALAGSAAPQEIDLAALLPAERAHVAYQGSLTAPPYTDGVAWRVLLQANTFSPAQLHALRAVHDGNNRALQPGGPEAFD